MTGIMGRFFRQSLLSYKALYGYLDTKVYLLVKVVNPIMQLIFFTLLCKYIYHTDDVTPWLIGNSFLLSVYNSLFGVGIVMNNERHFGTLKLVIASPANKFLVFVGRAFFHILDGLSSVILGLLIGVLLFHLNVTNMNILLFFITVLISMFAAMGMGLFIGSLGLVVSDMNLLLNLSMYVLFIFCGANFPVERLPFFLQNISYLLPVTRGIEACRLIAEGRITPHIYHLIGMEFVTGAVYMCIGFLFLIILEKLAKKSATLDVY
ncbi:ABC transporter permease [Sporolactobacillus shoreae]|uniref:Transport permease protein n=1 Tax=Sporolactobacillus shoreae TaxID=1465501 RepID=A0A4Z0GKQ5_9BACL|nr:ABC transporter permease [Sporolactobacillus shoreae]TGA96597.1 ABC transporter permease [Sporolactobacillus shoreae]